MANFRRLKILDCRYEKRVGTLATLADEEMRYSALCSCSCETSVLEGEAVLCGSGHGKDEARQIETDKRLQIIE